MPRVSDIALIIGQQATKMPLLHGRTDTRQFDTEKTLDELGAENFLDFV